MLNSDTDLSWLTALPDGAVVLNFLNEVVATNRLTLDILGTNPVGLLATSVIRAPAFATALKQARNSGQPATADLEFRGRPERHVSACVSPMGADGTVLVVLRDLTREQAVEKMRSDFVANASHEMRTPLAAIIGSIETLQGAAKDDPKGRAKFLATMLTQAQRMKRLIDDLLTLSRIELNEHVRPNNKVSLVSVAKQAKSNLAEQAKEAGLTIELTATDAVDVAGDPDELLQVALNLVENAIKYGGTGGKIELSCFATNQEGCLAVRDFGQGIAEEHVPRLTERFYRVSTKESRARGGTGLGLAICKHIINRHRGRFDISSEVGKGSQFTVVLPLVT
jgi:two-component system phosphate regulon sensor histidine kinase PhoR